MKRMTTLLFFAALSGACGGNTLDLGGPPDGDSSKTDAATDFSGYPVPAQRNARSLQSQGPYLYWMTDETGTSFVKRCDKSKCRNTQASIARINGTGTMGFEVRGDTMYIVAASAIYSCPLDDCSLPTALVHNVAPLATAFDGANVYWIERGLAAIFSCPLAGCMRPTRRNVGGPVPIELAVDETRLYWTQGPLNFSTPAGIAWVPKDDASPLTSILVSGLRRAMGLTLHDGFLYWSNSDNLGAVMRCPVTGCIGGAPEILADRQYCPLYTTRFDDQLFWMNGLSIPQTTHNSGRPIEIHGCILDVCSSTNEVIVEGTGGGFGLRVTVLPNTSNPPALPPREMVVDSDFIYWFGDISEIDETDPGNWETDASIRRAERRVRR